VGHEEAWKLSVDTSANGRSQHDDRMPTPYCSGTAREGSGKRSSHWNHRLVVSGAAPRLMCAAVVLLCSACPQLLDDGFRIQSEPLSSPDGAVPPLQNGEAASGGGVPADASDAGAAVSTGTIVATSDGVGVSDATNPRAHTCRSGSHATAGGACYAPFETKVNWFTARAQCQAQGSGWDLASIRSSLDSELLVSLVSREMWVGASDQALEGSWLWVDDDTVFWQGDGTGGSAVDGVYANWNSDEPNGKDPSDCMRILPSAKWADLQCENTLGYICMGPQD
jgi:hypothetical protein